MKCMFYLSDSSGCTLSTIPSCNAGVSASNIVHASYSWLSTLIYLSSLQNTSLAIQLGLTCTCTRTRAYASIISLTFDNIILRKKATAYLLNIAPQRHTKYQYK